MRRLTAIPQLLASLAWVLLVAGNALHSPLAHHHGDGCCGSGACEADDPESGCGHSHAHHHSGEHSHSHHHSGDHEDHEPEAPESDHGPQLTHDCKLCQFLGQAVNQLSLPSLPEGRQAVCAPAVHAQLLVHAHRLNTPPARGPPLST